MPRFQYTVITKDGKKLNGTIDSADEKGARRDLNSLGFSIMNIQQIDETEIKQEENTITFEFEAFDKKGKKVIGTISAQDKYEAFKRLKIEYEFTVLNIVKGALSSYEKEQERQSGVSDLEKQLEEEQAQGKQKSPISADHSLQAQAEQQENIESEEAKILKEQINFVLQKVTELINKYGGDLEIDARQTINQQVNKLLRIKSSTNLTYIRESCQELLKSIQEQESLMVNKENDFEKSKLNFEVSKMLDEIKTSKIQKSWREEKIEKLDHFLAHNELTAYTPLLLKLKIKIANLLLTLIKESEEIRKIRAKHHAVEEQINDYHKMLKHEESPQIKDKIKEFLRALNEKEKLYKNQIKIRKRWEREQYLAGLPETFTITLLKEIYTFTGWLLAFYLIYYFISIYISTKNFGFGEIPPNFRVYDSSFFKYILVMLFLAHSSISLKINFFRNSIASNILIFPTTLVIIMLILFNL